MPSTSSPENLTAGASSSSSAGGTQRTTYTAAGDLAVNLNPLEKTISCVSCRKRKLKCDRVKPCCGTCTRLRHECEYPERRRNVISRRRNMKELEERLAQVETKLVGETSNNTLPNNSPNKEPDWNDFPISMDMDINMGMNIDFGNDAFMDLPNPVQDFAFQVDQIQSENIYSQEMVALGLEEALPPDEMIEELHQVYFDKVHQQMPMIHKQRYLASLNLPPHMRPSICLRYIIWATAATLVDRYSQYDDVFYKRARKYLEQAEMKGHGETFVTVSIAQAWALLANYEAKKTYFTRAWMSSGRLIRLCLMLGLDRLDGKVSGIKQILQPCKDLIELEERRRTFWFAFYNDRWASCGTGWPMMIDESLIMTNLPSSEGAYELGTIETSISLKEALSPAGIGRLSSFGGVILSACLFGHNYEHLHLQGSDERPDDLINGDFWKRHRKMDNDLSNTFMFLPDHLRLPSGIRDLNVVFLHMNIHASTICLHQAAVATAEKKRLDRSFIKRCQTRCLMAAEEIASTMRLITHMDATYMNSWMGFCLYVASGVFIQDLVNDTERVESRNSLEFLLAAMNAIGSKHSTTAHFTVQVELDIESSGINVSKSRVYGNIDGPSLRECLSRTQPSFLLPGSHTGPYVGLYENQTEASGLGRSTNFGRSSEGQPDLKVTPIYGIQPVNDSTHQVSSIFDPSWNSSHESSHSQALVPTSADSIEALPSASVDRERKEGVHGKARWTTSETCSGKAGPDKSSAAASPQAPSNDGVYNDSISHPGGTQENWVFEATMPVNMCPYSTL